LVDFRLKDGSQYCVEIEENAGYLGVESTAAAISFLLST